MELQETSPVRQLSDGFIRAKPNELWQQEWGGGKGERGGGGVCEADPQQHGADSGAAGDAETGPALCNADVECVMERRGCADGANFYRAFL